MIPLLKPLIDPLTVRFAHAWAKAQTPEDDGEFNTRVCAVLHYELGMLEVGRNGKRGNPANLSKDVINWRGEGPNPDPINGGFGTIIDFIPDHGSPNARIGQQYPDPNGPGAWVKPLTLAQIDAGEVPGPKPQAPSHPSYEDLGGDEGGKKITRQLDADFRAAGRPGLDRDCGAWQQRVAYDFLTGKFATVEASTIAHRDDWLGVLGLIEWSTGMMSHGKKCLICGASVGFEKGKPRPIPHTPECAPELR